MDVSKRRSLRLSPKYYDDAPPAFKSSCLPEIIANRNNTTVVIQSYHIYWRISEVCIQSNPKQFDSI